MVFIPTGERQVGTPGGAVLPSPSGVRLNIAGSQARAVSQLGGALFDVGLKAQRANDNAEFSEMSIKTTSDVETELTRLKQAIQDPDLYNVEARKAIDRITSEAQKNIGRRNRTRFGAVIANINSGANKAIINERFGKIVDREKVSFEGIKDAGIEDMLNGKMTGDQAIATAEAKLSSMFSNGIINQQEFVKDLRKYKVRVKTEEFLGTYKSNPEGAVKKIESDPELLAEQKIDILHKMSSRVTKWNKELEKVVTKATEDAMIKVSKFIDDDEIRDAETLDAIMGVEGFDYKQRKALTKDFQDKISGRTIDDTLAFNEYADDVLRNPNIFSNLEIQTFEDLSPQKRIDLLNIKTRLLSNPIFSNPLFREGMGAIEDEFARNFLDNIDPTKQSRKVDERLAFIDNISARVEAGETNLIKIIREEIDSSLTRIRENRGSGIKVRGEQTVVEKKRGQNLLRRLQNGTITKDEMEEYQDLLKK